MAMNLNIDENGYYSRPDTADVFIESSSGKYAEIFISSVNESYSISVLGSPGEKGIVKFDNRVRNPTIVSIEGNVRESSYAVLKKLRSLQKKGNLNEALCKFYGRDGECVSNLVVTKLVVRTTSDRLNMVGISLELQEFIMA